MPSREFLLEKHIRYQNLVRQSKEKLAECGHFEIDEDVRVTD
jgi:hypothetical protein